MTLAASGILAVPIVALQSLVASSATFQALVGASGATAASEHVYLQLADDEEEPETDNFNKKLKAGRPRAIVATSNNWDMPRQGPGEWTQSGTYLLSFELLIPPEYMDTHNNQCVWFLNQIGGILVDMRNNRDAGLTSQYLPITGMRYIDDPMPCDEDPHIEFFWGVTFEVSFN